MGERWLLEGRGEVVVREREGGDMVVRGKGRGGC